MNGERTVQTTLPAAVERRLRSCGSDLGKTNSEIAGEALAEIVSNEGLPASMFPKIRKSKSNRKWGAVVDASLAAALKGRAQEVGVEQTAIMRMALASWLDKNAVRKKATSEEIPVEHSLECAESKRPNRKIPDLFGYKCRHRFAYCPHCGERLY